MRLFQVSYQVIRIIIDDFVVHEFRSSYDRNGKFCYAILEDLTKTINFQENLKFKIENLQIICPSSCLSLINV